MQEARSAMVGRVRWAVVVGLLVLVGACTFNVDLGGTTLFPIGTAFVVSGTADLVDTEDGACPVWLGDNGVTYHLFQNPRVDNADYDQITTPGVTSRLELATRTDLVIDCQVGTIVEVQNVLEIVP
ncbi:MAG: hypothetical protein H6817_06660 [Phycisphaerales bacterium]|nr:hypothetical protein [Phycisphaerales bacterium]